MKYVLLMGLIVVGFAQVNNPAHQPSLTLPLPMSMVPGSPVQSPLIRRAPSLKDVILANRQRAKEIHMLQAVDPYESFDPSI